MLGGLHGACGRLVQEPKQSLFFTICRMLICLLCSTLMNNASMAASHSHH